VATIIPQTAALAINQTVEKPKHAAWATSQARRDRLGMYAPGTLDPLFGVALTGARLQRAGRLLTAEQLWKMYERTPDIRACVDNIARLISTWDWIVEPTIDPQEARYADIMSICGDTMRWLQSPNDDGATWQEMVFSLVVDTLVYESGVWELAENALGELEELVPWLGSEFTPIKDKHGRLLTYEQVPEGALGTKINFPPERLMFFQLFPNTRKNLGVPLIETIVNEAATVILSSEHARLAIDVDEIPPGILVVSGIEGDAAQRARADMESMSGKDHKIRLVTSPEPGMVDAKWVELRHTMKDIAFREVLDDIRRVIWRVFGVMPIEMGATDGMPRATANAQVEVAGSHLVQPLLELLQAKVQRDIISRIVGVEVGDLVQFRFDRDAKLKPDEVLAQERAYDVAVKNATMTINEVRQARGHMPHDGDLGDTPFVWAGGGPTPLASIVKESEDDGPDPVDEPTDDDTMEEEPEVSDPEEIAATIADFQARRWARRSVAGDLRVRAGSLPSDWPDYAHLKNYRAIDMDRVGVAVGDYMRVVGGLYAETHSEILAAARAAAGRNAKALNEESAARLRNRVTQALDGLAVRWEAATASLYRDAAWAGRDAAVDATGVAWDVDVDARARQYANAHLQYLTSSSGLLGKLHRELTGLIAATVDHRAALVFKAVEHGVIRSGKDAFLTAITSLFASQRHRVGNWAGKLVELANQLLLAGFAAAEALTAGEQEWWGEWVAVGDNRMCQDCAREGAAGLRPMRQIRLVPGGDTRCGARCRCYLVAWTGDEVKSGRVS